MICQRKANQTGSIGSPIHTVGGSEAGSSEVGGSEVGGGEVGGSEVGGIEVGGSEVGGSEVGVSEVGSSVAGKSVVGAPLGLTLRVLLGASLDASDVNEDVGGRLVTRIVGSKLVGSSDVNFVEVGSGVLTIVLRLVGVAVV